MHLLNLTPRQERGDRNEERVRGEERSGQKKYEEKRVKAKKKKEEEEGGGAVFVCAVCMMETLCQPLPVKKLTGCLLNPQA